MKKNIFLLTFLFQPFSLFCCEPKNTKLEFVDLDTHMAGIAALISAPRPSDDGSRRLHKYASGFLIAALARQPGNNCTFSHPKFSRQTTFSLICTPYNPSDKTISIEEHEKNARYHKDAAVPVYKFYTRPIDTFAENCIQVTDPTAIKRSNVFLSPSIAPTSEEVNLIIESRAVYTIGAIPVQKATDKTLAGFAAKIRIQSEVTKKDLLVLPPPFPESTIIAEASLIPHSESQVVRIWTIPQAKTGSTV